MTPSTPPSNPPPQAATTFKFNPFLPDFHQNPYPIYHRLRQESPIYQTHSFQGEEWLLTRYVDVKTVLNDTRFYADDLPQRLQQKSRFLQNTDGFDALTQTISGWLFFLDPPDHTRLRSILSKAFSLGELEALQGKIQQLVEDFLDRLDPTQPFDVMAHLASPLPASVTAAMVGVPTADRDRLTDWSRQLFRVFDQPMSLKDYEALNQIARQFQDYFLALIAERQRQPQADLLSRLIAACQEQRLSEAEVLSYCAMLFSVGQETTENFIGNSVLALLNHPEQRQQLQAHPDLWPKAIEELLRFDSPVQIIARTVREAVTLEGKTLPAGGRVHLCLGAANRDPAQFSHPDTLNFYRQETAPIPFGAGIHYCLGGVLARLEGQIALRTLFQRFPHLHLATDSLQWRQNLVLRGVATLPVSP